jgi:hypothetical protein
VTAATRITEAEFTDQLFGQNGLATMLGWASAHFRPAQNRRGHWQTPVSGELGKGWPDWFLCHPTKGRSMYRELKREGQWLDDDQARVHAVLAASGCDIDVWRPADLDSGRILDELR